MQPRRMSIPITCSGRKDYLFHILYGGNAQMIRSFIEQSVIDVAREYPTDGVRDALHLLRPRDGDSLNRLRALFFLLLAEDEAMRRRVCAAPSGQMVAPFCEHRARLFYDELCDELIPAFVQRQEMRLDEFVDALRGAYLHS